MIRGISQDNSPERTPEGYVYWAKNCLMNNKLDACINEKGTLPTYATAFNFDFLCGVTTITDKIIALYKSTAGEDCISVYDEFTQIVTVRLVRTDLNFNNTYPIRLVAKYNSNNELVIAFVQQGNTPKYINLDTATPADSLNFYNLFPIIDNPTDIIGQVIDGGAVQGGAYYFTFAYIAKDRTRTTYTTFSNPIYVSTVNEAEDFTTSVANKAGASTNKSIRVTINNVDVSYGKVSVAMISRINGVVAQSIIKEVAITGTTLTFIYGGTEFLSAVTLDELIADNIRYTEAKFITTLNDELFLADLQVGSITDYQTLINTTSVRWVSTIDTVNTVSTKSKFKAGNNKSFIHDEVVALYLQLELTDGTLTDWFHVPGRAPGAGETSNSGLSTGGLTINGRTPYVYEIQDTASVSTAIPMSGGIYGAKGAMGFWQNDNEVYPTTTRWGALGGQKVRHHKFPSIDFFATSVYNADATYGISNLDKLDIEITNSALFTRPEVKSYRLGYARRSLADVGVVGMGLVHFAGAPEGGDNTIVPGDGQSYDSKTLWSTAGNFKIGCANGSGDDAYVNTQYTRFNSFDIWQDRPALAGTYLRNYLKLKANKLEEGAVGYAGGSTYGMISPGPAGLTMVAYASNFTVQGANNTTKSASDVADKVRKLTDPSYIPNHSKVFKDSLVVDNLGLEETVLAKIEGSALNLGIYGALLTKTSGPVGDPNMAEETYLAAIKNPKSDYFLGFEGQTIVASSTLVRTSSPTTIVNFGDGFIGVHTYVALSAYNHLVDQTTDETQRVVNFKMHVGVGRHNVGLRYQLDGQYSSYFYPTGGLFTLGTTGAYGHINEYWFYNYSKKLPWNQFLYSKDYSSLNDFETFGVFIEDLSNQNIFPYRIARSTKASRDNSLNDGWKTFKAADYFDSVATKGPITNLVGWGNDALLIHHRNALFRTRDKAILQADIISISLGSGDIFALEPKEARATKEGIGGTQHSFSCILTEFGYFYTDAESGLVYIYDGENLEEAGKGLRLFFLENLGCEHDNPFNRDDGEQAIVSAYDQVNNRLFLCQKAVGSNWTVTYDSLKQEWSSAHDYVGDFIFNTRANIYSYLGRDMFTHNVGPRGNYYGVLYPFYVDFIINEKPTEEKILQALRIIVKVKDTAGNILQRKTVTHITVWNDQYCTGKIPVVTNETESLFSDSNIKVVDQAWFYNDLLDQVADPNQPFIDTLLNDSRPITSNLKVPVWYDTEVLRGKYFIVRLEYDNIENKEVHLRELTPSLELSQ